MSCTRPLTAYRDVTNCKIHFKRQKNLPHVPIKLPCGKCMECRLEKSRQWSVRIENEASMHKENCFLTLTYNDKCIPMLIGKKVFRLGDLENINIKKLNQDIILTLYKRDVTLFIKKLRNKIHDKKLRYYLCGEYGENFSRPHYHIVLFGHDFANDRYPFKMIKGKPAYRSLTLEKCWRYGFSTVQKFEYACGAYVAKYVTKKITGELAKDHYKGAVPEFALMSRRPGIGYEYYKKYKKDIHNHGRIYIKKGLAISPPRFYNNLIEKDDPEVLARHKEERRLKSERLDIDERAYLDNVREKQNKCELKKRRFEKCQGQ